MKSVVVIGALPSSLVNFRGELLKAIVKKKYSVIGMGGTNDTDITSKLSAIGVAFHSYSVERNALNPFHDMKTLVLLCKAFRKFKPDVMLAYTIKPIIWGGLAIRRSPNTRFFALITGLGFAFQGGSFKRDLLGKLVTFLYRTALKRAECVVFQNPDNLKEFLRLGIVPKEKCALVNGSGVDVSRYYYTAYPAKPITFLTIGRLLGEKGFREYAHAAKIVKAQYPHVIFQLLGPEDPSPDGILLSEVAQWQKQGVVEYLGSKSDVRPYLQGCHVYVLPSYHEGMPRTVLEAMATGRPILTTDVPGCRETVILTENGFLVPKADAEALAERMTWFIENRDQWEKMGKRSRQLAEEKYDVHKVNIKLMEILGL